MPEPQFLEPNDTFVPRHIGPTESEIQTMLETLNVPSLESLVEATVPSDIRLQGTLAVPSPRRAGGLGGVAQHGRTESGVAVLDRDGLLRLHYPAGHST